MSKIKLCVRLELPSFLIVVLPSNQIKLKLVVIIWLLSNKPTKQLEQPSLTWLHQLGTVCNTSAGMFSGSNKRGDLYAIDVETGKVVQSIKKAHRYTDGYVSLSQLFVLFVQAC